MKNIALLTGALCAIGSAAWAQSVVIIPAFENRFAGIHQPVIVVHTIDRSPGFQRQTFGAGSSMVTSPGTTSATRQRLDPTVMNVPVFPGNTVLLQQQGAFGPFGAFPSCVGVGNTGVTTQEGAGGSPTEADPFRNVAPRAQR